MIVVVATMRALTGRERELREVLEGLIPVTRAEAGCIQYDMHVADNDPASFLFYERWESHAALDAHLMTPHMGQAMVRAGEILDGPVSIVRYSLAS